MKQIYESPRQKPSEAPSMFPLAALLVGVALVLAWPALLLGLLIGLGGKYWQFPFLVWAVLTLFGLGGLWLLYSHVGMVLALHVMIQHIPPFASWRHLHVLLAFLPYLSPLWLRSLLITPLFALAIHLFPQRMEEQLLHQERTHLRAQEQASHRAKRRLRHVPDQMKGKAVLGRIIHPLH